MSAAASRPPAILVGGEAIALAVGRRLAAAGAPVYGLGHELDPLRDSRVTAEFVPAGHGPELQRRALEWLEREGPREGVIFPCDDEPLDMVAHNRERLASWGYAVTESTDEGILAMLDKAATYRIAADAGLATPRWIPLESPAEALEGAAEIGFPCAVKPAVSHEWARHYPLHTKALTASGPEELEAAVAELGEIEAELMLVEMVPGGDGLYASLYAYRAPDGRRLAAATKRKVRQFPPGIGQSTLNVLEWDEEVADRGWRLIEAAELEGIAYVEFKRDPRDGELRLIECNHRVVGPTELLDRPGHDLALLAYRRATGEDAGELRALRHDGSALIWPGLDARSAARSIRAGDLTVFAWARSLMRRLRLPIFRWRDPKPSAARIARKIVRRLPGRR